MDKLGVVPQKKASKTASYKAKKKPIKVVYISNPVKFTTSASQFRALVQELTGQDADPPLDTAEFSPTDSSLQDDEPVGAGSSLVASSTEEDCPVMNAVPEISSTVTCARPFELLKEGCHPQILDDFNDFLASSLFYELHDLETFRSMDPL